MFRINLQPLSRAYPVVQNEEEDKAADGGAVATDAQVAVQQVPHTVRDKPTEENTSPACTRGHSHSLDVIDKPDGVDAPNEPRLGQHYGPAAVLDPAHGSVHQVRGHASVQRGRVRRLRERCSCVAAHV